MSSEFFPAKIVEVLDDGRVVINKGREHGVKKGQSFLVYELGKEIFDPDTKESLGVLEITKGRGQVDHVMDKMATIISIEFEYEEEEQEPLFRGALAAALGGGGQIKRTNKRRLDFNDVKEGDLAKPI